MNLRCREHPSAHADSPGAAMCLARMRSHARASTSGASLASSPRVNHPLSSRSVRRIALRVARRPRAVVDDPESDAKDDALRGDEDLTRLWSNVDARSDSVTRVAGNVASAVALVAGTTLGAGMLALPIVLRDAGFVPSTVVILACWAFFACSGLCVLEVNLGTMCALGRAGGVTFNALAERTLGSNGTKVATASYAFIHYALLVAYVQKVGELATEAFPTWPGGSNAASVAFTATMSMFLYLASPAKIEKVNSVLFAGVIATFVPLLAVAAQSGSAENLLAVSDWSKTPATIPIIAVAFVYHQVVPVVATSLEGDKSRAQTAILLGTLIPALMFILWDAAVLGSVPVDSSATIDPIATLQAASPLTATLVRGFELFAVMTSFLGFGWGLAGYIADGLKTTEDDPLPWALALAPPLIFALTNPDVFLAALDSAGAFGVLVVFGMMPPVMAYRHRRARTECSIENDPAECLPVLQPALPGGDVALLVVFTLATAFVADETNGLIQSFIHR